jgi:hypothetical protein
MTAPSTRKTWHPCLLSGAESLTTQASVLTAAQDLLLGRVRSRLIFGERRYRWDSAKEILTFAATGVA